MPAKGWANGAAPAQGRAAAPIQSDRAVEAGFHSGIKNMMKAGNEDVPGTRNQGDQESCGFGDGFQKP